MEIWKRTNATLAYEWDVTSFEKTEPDRPNFEATDRIRVSNLLYEIFTVASYSITLILLKAVEQ